MNDGIIPNWGPDSRFGLNATRENVPYFRLNKRVHTPVQSDCLLKFLIGRRFIRDPFNDRSERLPHRPGHVNEFGLVVCVPKVCGSKHLRADDAFKGLEARVVEKLLHLGGVYPCLHGNTLILGLSIS